MSSGLFEHQAPRFHKAKEELFYMSVAREAAKMSHAVRKKVGACVVTASGAMFYGYNGTLAGKDNTCEFVENGLLVTKPDVVHAEVNALAKAAREGVSTVGSIVYVTLSPCIPCSTILASFGVKGVVIDEVYRDPGGILELVGSGIAVRKCIADIEHLPAVIPSSEWQPQGEPTTCAGRVCC